MSKSTSLTLSSPTLLAEALRLPELRGLLERRYVAPPDHAATLIRDGAIVETFTGANFAIGGVAERLKSLFVGKHHVRVVLTDLRPFSLQAPFRATTRDHVEVEALATLELQVDPERAVDALGLLGPTDRVGRTEVLDRLLPHLDVRAIESALARVDADEIRGDTGLQDHLQANVMREVERIAGDLGLTVRAVTLGFATNAVERAAAERATLDREQERLDAELADLRRDVERGAEATTVRLGSDADVEKLRLATEDELEHLVLSNALALEDVRDADERRRELTGLTHRAEVLRAERAARIEERLANTDADVEVAGRQLTLRRSQLELERIDAEARLALRRAETEADQDLTQRGRGLDLEHQRRTNDVGREHVAGLAAIEREQDAHAARLREAERDGVHARDVDRMRTETASRVAQLEAGARMTPEQILAINAGLSGDVAAVLAEQARANARGADEKMELMRQMVAQASDARIASEAQARDMFRSAMDGTARVAAGAGGGGAAGSGAGTAGAAASVECAQCGRTNESTHRFCIGCGQRLRV